MGREPSTSFEEAIALEPRRQAAGGLAARHGSYLMRGRYAEQLERVFRLFSPSQVSVELFDDLRADPLLVYQRICAAAGIAAAPPPAALQARNRVAGVRSQALARAMNSAPVRTLAAVLPRPLRQRARTGLRQLNEMDFTPPPLPAALAVELRSRLRPDVERLEQLIGRDLSHWKTP
jgi:hypothetical protein